MLHNKTYDLQLNWKKMEMNEKNQKKNKIQNINNKNKMTKEVINEAISQEQISENNNQNSEILKLKNTIFELKKKELELVLRSKAEIENIRKRTLIDIEKAYKFSLEKFSNELLPTIDNLERTIKLINKNNSISPSILEGLELTLKSFINVMKKNGVQKIETNNVPFNPELHQAMTIIDSDVHKPNHVIETIQKGYMLNGRLLRPAMVIVSKDK